MEPPCDQQYVRVPFAHFRSIFTLHCDLQVTRPPVLRFLSLLRTEQGGQVDSVRIWFFREVMVDIRLVTFSVVARLSWARFSMCVWLARVTLRNSLVRWACSEKWA